MASCTELLCNCEIGEICYCDGHVYLFLFLNRAATLFGRTLPTRQESCSHSSGESMCSYNSFYVLCIVDEQIYYY